MIQTALHACAYMHPSPGACQICLHLHTYVCVYVTVHAYTYLCVYIYI